MKIKNLSLRTQGTQRCLKIALVVAAIVVGLLPVRAATHFVEAESFQVKGDGWAPFLAGQDPSVGAASGAKTLFGGHGAGDSVATTPIEITQSGNYRLWVRYMESPWHSPFTIRVQQNGRDVAIKTFDAEARPDVGTWQFSWSPLNNVPLTEGFVTLLIEKLEGKNYNVYTRHLDCFLLTDDLQLQPTHVAYGPQTYLRVTLGDIYDKPVYVHLFADHFRDPWYAHYAISKSGWETGLQPAQSESLMRGGEATPWVNITETIYQDSGVILLASIRENYHKILPRLKARFEFATAPSEKAIVKTIHKDITFDAKGVAGGVTHIIVPPDLVKPGNLKWLITDAEIAETTGRMADKGKWPTIGKKPQHYPFLVTDAIHARWPNDKKVVEREHKTLDYFGFNNHSNHIIAGAWLMLNNCYSQPDIPAMKAQTKAAAEEFAKSGKKTENIAWSLLMDEPQAQPLEHIAQCAACTAAFCEWLQETKVPLADLGVGNWAAVKPVQDGKEHPALYYYSQRFRVHAMAKFMALQRQFVREAYGRNIPAAPNFSDGATYNANFYTMGVDYFQLLDPAATAARQNALWSENWGNNAASRQASTYNVELMRSAAMTHGQSLGHYLIGYAGRLPWDIKVNAVSQAARDVKILENFWYGPSWAGHEGGPPWANSGWYSKPETWFSNAELVHEFGGAEELLYPAKKVRSAVGIIYSSSSDIWTLGRTFSFGFDRMFTWMALTHRQIAVDFLSEKMVAESNLNNYRVLCLSGPNLTQAAAKKLMDWVKQGGALVLTAAGASRDEFNRPLNVLDEVLPATRSEIDEFQPFQGAGGSLDNLTPRGVVVTADKKARLELLSARQVLTLKAGSQLLATYEDGTPAYASAPVGKGMIYQAGFLPGLSYMYPALTARKKLERAADKPNGRVNTSAMPDPSKVVPAAVVLQRSHSPWEYPAAIGDLIVKPVFAAGVTLPVRCSVPLVDAVLMEGEKGAVVPLSNYTLQPLASITLTVTTKRKVKRVQSVHHKTIPFTRQKANQIKFTLPLRETDFVLLHY
jgi:hypothetical protein